MKLFIIIFYLFGLNAHANDGDSADLLRMFRALNLTVKSPNPTVKNCPTPPQFSGQYIPNDSDRSISKFRCYRDESGNMMMRKYCADLADRLCVPKYGNEGFNCTNSNSSFIRESTWDAARVDEAVRLTKERFAFYKNVLAKKCCKNKRKCLNRFNKTKLTIKDDLKVTAYYTSSNQDIHGDHFNEIVMTKGKILSALNQENIERVLLHELGHSCQFALISENENLYERFTSPTRRCEENRGKIMAEEVLGKAKTRCIQYKLNAARENIPPHRRGNYCFGKWWREAFATMVFREFYDSPAHWTYECYVREPSKNHPPMRHLITCGESFQQITEMTCSN